MLDTKAQHFDGIVIFQGNSKFLGEADLHLQAQHEIGSIAKTRRFPIRTHNCPARGNPRLARRDLATGCLLGNEAAEKSQEKY